MGKGDRKTYKGKLFMGSYGKKRRHSKDLISKTATTAETPGNKTKK